MEGRMILLENVCKSFGETRVLGGVNLQAEKNEFIVLVGPGQCGKTTLINVMAGLEKATSGRVEVGGRAVERPDPSRGVVYQTTLLFPWLTTMGNVCYGPRAQGMNKKQDRERAQRYIDLVGLSGFEKSYPVQLSGGMKQRVGIARAYASGPEVIFMDEPFGHLDAQTRYQMQREVERIWETEKKTVVFVTNNIEEAVYLADRVLVLTNCPTRVKAEFTVDLPRPRDYMSPEFLELRKRIGSVIDPTE